MSYIILALMGQLFATAQMIDGTQFQYFNLGEEVYEVRLKGNCMRVALLARHHRKAIRGLLN